MSGAGSAALPGPVRDCLDGRISPQVAIAQLLFQGHSAAAIRAVLDRCPAHARRDELRALLQGRETQLDGLAAQVAATEADHDASGPTAADGIARIAGFFDRAVAHSPEASVALYSLGDPALLAAATDEVMGWLAAQALLAPEADVLDLGCGFGRLSAAMAARCRSVLGLDVSAGMIAEASRRFGTLANVRFARTSGQDLAGLRDASLDLVLAGDSFPYIVQTGEDVAARHVQEAARVLRPGGAMCILNLSYRGDDAQDAADARRWAAAAGMRLQAAPTRPFTLWDGSAYVLRR